MESNFTIWVGNEDQAHIRIVVRDATNVKAAIREALKEAAQRWACDPDTLNIHGIAEGDITDLDPESTSD
jgi:hypothetical protein